MVQLRDPLRHTVVIGVFRLEEELQEAVADDVVETANPAVGRKCAKGGAAIACESQPAFLVDRNRTRGSVDGLDQLIVEIRCADRHLRLLETKHAVMMPRRLAERHKCYRMDRRAAS